jgi:hypothetical protein
MFEKARKFTFLIVGFFVFSGFLIMANSAQAVSNSVIRGQAYWGNKGYVYFSCTDDIIGNRFDEVKNLNGGTRYVPPASLLFHFYAEPCDKFVHGVEINTSNIFLGKAWNPSMGYINFGYDGVNAPPDYNFAAAHCPSCSTASNCVACYDEADQSIYGYARIEYNGDWIKLNSTSTVPVKLQSNDLDPVLPGYNVSSGDFVGTASAGSYNDISFNCESEDYPGLGVCDTRQYRVYVKNLRLGRLSAPNWSYTSACTGDALRAVLRWGKLSGTQTAYEVLVNDSNTMSTSSGAFVCWSDKVANPSATQYIISNANPYCGNRLQYGHAYYWWIRAYDEEDKPTEWYQYVSNSVADTDQNLDGNALTFQTFKHEFPSPFFSWAPLDVMTGTTTTFTGDSYAYLNSNPQLPVSCEPGRCSYLWMTTDPDATIYATTSAVTGINFFTATNTRVTLVVTDAENYVCSSSSPEFKVNYDLPIWHEIKAK